MASYRLSIFGLLLFTAHTLLEAGLGAVKVSKGGYKGFDMPPGGEKFARHHGVSLMSLALLGACVLARRSWSEPEGYLASIVICAFHAGCVFIGPSPAVLLLHGSLAVGFGTYLVMPKRSPRKAKP